MHPIRIGNASGFYGDRYSAVREMLTGGPLDVLTGDYLAELTMLILGRDRLKDPSAGYAKTFLRQMKDNLQLALDQGVKIVSNAGGLNPAALAAALEELGTGAHVAYVTGDDLSHRAAEFGNALTANAYLGAFGIAECLKAGADIVVTGRVTDASLVVGPAIAHFGWSSNDYDQLAGATIAGHIIECGAQATGGNYSFFTELHMGQLGFPIAVVNADGSSVITKHPGTGGAVNVGTVTAQLLYEIAGPRYAGPDVTTRFDSITLAETPLGVCVPAAIGEPPPPTMKVCLNHLAGFRNDVTFVLTGLDIEAKADLVRAQLASDADLTWTLSRTDHADASGQAEASALLRVTAKSQDPKVAGRAFSSAAVELALASYPGFTLTAPPADATPYAIYTAAYIDQFPHTAVLPSGEAVPIAVPEHSAELSEVDPVEVQPWPGGPTRSVPLGLIAGARSGDKGGTANVGVWVRSDAAWRWLADFLTVERFRELLPEAQDVVRHVLPNLRALNFVCDGLLGEGVAAGTRFDPQGKGLGEWLRSRYVDIPEELL